MYELFAAIVVVVVALPFVVGLMLAMALWRAWWLYPAWGWFLVPLGAPAITFWHFAALLLIVGTVTAHEDTKKDERKTDRVAIVASLFAPMIWWALLRFMR
jgi:hypothetical protein